MIISMTAILLFAFFLSAIKTSAQVYHLKVAKFALADNMVNRHPSGDDFKVANYWAIINLKDRFIEFIDLSGNLLHDYEIHSVTAKENTELRYTEIKGKTKVDEYGTQDSYLLKLARDPKIFDDLEITESTGLITRVYRGKVVKR